MNEWKQVTIQSNSASQIVGLYAAANKAKATIVLGHPMGKEAKGYFLKHGYTELLLKNGYNVLAFDFNGFGESTNGSFSYFEDIVAIGKKAKELTPNLKIGYLGISLGGQMAIIAFTDDTHCYDFAIIESAATTLDEFWVHFPVASKALKLINIIMPKFKQKVKMVERIKEIKKIKSILFVYSLTDHLTPASMGEQFQKNCPVKSELWTVPDASHAMIMKSDYAELYKRKIIDYIDNVVNEQYISTS